MKALRPLAPRARAWMLPGKWRQASTGCKLGIVPRPLLACPVTVLARSRREATSPTLPVMTMGFGLHLADGSPPMGPQVLEERIERVIYRCRFMTFLGVFGSLVGSILCFLKGCAYVMRSFAEYFVSGGKLVLTLLEAIDIYLIGTVMLVFGMGLYELFITNFDFVKQSSHGSNLLGLFQLRERPKCLEIKSVNELKTKVGHVIVMALLVGFVDKSKKVTIGNPRDLLCFAASILLSSCGLYLLSKLHDPKERSKGFLNE